MKSQTLTLKAPAKINLFLKIVARRSDGYHEIETLMHKVALFDVVRLAREGNSLALSCRGSKVPDGRENLAWKAAEAFFSVAGLDPAVRIELEKNITVAAGLGGGSSDAAAVLLGLNRLFDAGLEQERLLGIGAGLGADVPFFLQEFGCALATGIGEKLEPMGHLGDCWVLLVNPGFAVSTRWAYENFPLTSTSNPYILARGRITEEEFHGAAPRLVEELGNDLEAVTIARFPEIGSIKKELKKAGASAALMSGSGPTVFGLFAGKEQAQHAFTQFAGLYGDSVFLVRPYIS
ncbi:MAG: 4-(cytidine 5'-diphospho)-2-C-methyl-D-erythritol kinase [Deltaproteobacteria bacterium]|jgi:4-diphosphocytidyl-2-C-methyl-D-erythritol kinase|nr:4-(cytidine 5'-diphospho)-2-C-methyl-D-erythritol kinase [Deltaproteobacteria bacterium]